jgi:hypothetical protein
MVIFVFTHRVDLPFSDIGNAIAGTGAAANWWVYEIYRPKTETLELFFEVGEKFSISNAGTGARAFSVTADSLDGDCELWVRKTYIRGDGGTPYNKANPLTTGTLFVSDTTPGMGTWYFEMMNGFDKNFNLWPGNIPGRSQLYSNRGSLESTKTNAIRFGQTYNKGGHVSNLNTFEDADEYALPLGNGPGTKLQDADNILAAICQNESSALYIGESFVNTSDGNQFIAKTDRVIGNDRKYYGGFGTLHPESICEYGGRIYYYDMTKGAIIRRANDGLNPISDYGVASYIRKFSRDNFANRATMRFPGGYDPVHDVYVLTAINTAGTVLWTIGFHEKTNFWVGFFDYLPQFYGKLNGYLVSFKLGQAWVHNNNTYMNLYGVQKYRDLEFAVALKGLLVDVWHGIGIDADDFYVDSGSNDDVVQITNDGAGFINSGTGTQYTTVTALELVKREGVWRAAICRDINTPQPYTPAIRAKFEGNAMRGQVIRVKIKANKTTTTARMRAVGILFRTSQLS